MITADRIGGVFTAGLILVCCTGCPTQGVSSAEAEPIATRNKTTVKTVLPQRTTLRRTTTQPATVRAYYQAEMYAKVAGYLEELNVDIGQSVERGAVLGTIAVPEMVKSYEKQEATVRRLQADEKRAEAGITVAEANTKSAVASLEQARADVTSADAQLRADRIEYERVSELVQRKAVSERLRDEALKRLEAAEAAKAAVEAAVVSAGADISVADAKLQAARADLAAARAQTEVASKETEELAALVAYATLRAPFPGVVTERHVDPGDLIRKIPAPSKHESPPLFVIVQLDKVRCRVAVPERDAPWADAGDAAVLEFQAFPGRSFPGEISRIAGSLEESTRTMVVEIDLENPGHKLLPGMFGEATIVLEEHKDSIVLPAGAIRHDESGRSYAYVVDASDRIAVVDVSIGLDDGQMIEITSGLAGTERVVDAMIGRLKPGQVVRVQEP